MHAMIRDEVRKEWQRKVERGQGGEYGEGKCLEVL
jgi:hypothetical protein